MKKLLLFNALVISFAILFYPSHSISNVNGSPGGKSGSIGDNSQNCTSCHAGTVNSGTGNALISTNIPSSGYVPGNIYTITMNVNESGVNKFGFELTAEDASGNKEGTFFVTNSTETKFTNTNTAITHKLAGTTGSTDSRSWTMDWEAPLSGVGDITFSASGLAANYPNNNTGDNVYTSSILVSEFIPPTQGCTDPLACNYDPLATVDDGSCLYLPTIITHPFDTSIFVGTSVILSVDYINGVGAVSYQWYSNTVNSNSGGAPILGATNSTYIPPTNNIGAIYYYCIINFSDPSCGGMIVSNIGQITVLAAPVPGCTDPLACNYDPLATVDDSSCVYSATLTTVQVHCDTFNWFLNGVTYTSSIIDTIIVPNVNGCLDTNILDLTIHSSTTNYDTVVACNSYLWNGITYTYSTIDTITGANSNGCLEINILNLTINIGGCTDSLAFNYDSLASCDDGSCIPFPQNLFFSEAAEGSSNNKYFEVYNPTVDTIDLTNYAFARVTNNPGNGIGVYEAWVDFDSGSVIAPNDVYIVSHQSASATILAESDMNYGSMSNGDDGFALVYGNEPANPISPQNGDYLVLDWIGDWNGDPGSGWDVAGVNSATANHTLVRKCAINQGDTSWTNSAGTNSVNSQWIVLLQNDWTNIGFHNFCPCDSSTNSYTLIEDTICNGLSITVAGNTYDSTGIYLDTLLAFNGCDSIITTDLTVLNISASLTVIDTIICNGLSVTVGNNTYSTTGNYTDTLLNQGGCDSIITLNLTVQTPVNWSITICDGDSVLVGSSVYSIAGTYYDTIVSSIGCDSIVITNLNIYDQFGSLFGGPVDTATAPGAFSSYNGRLNLDCSVASTLVSSMVYALDTNTITFELRNSGGNVLDDTTITVLPGPQRLYFDFDIPVGTDLQLGVSAGGTDLYRNNAGTGNSMAYPYNIGNVSITSANTGTTQYYYFFYDIEIQQSASPFTYTICEGDSLSVDFGAQFGSSPYYSISGTYTDTLISELGCDSLVYTELIVVPNVTDTNVQIICAGEVYLIGGSVYDSTGVFIDTLISFNGCDSIVVLDLTVDTLTGGVDTVDVEICIGDSYSVGSNVYNTSGTYTDTLTAINGCDSILITNLTVTNIYSSTFGGIDDPYATGLGGGYFSGNQYLELSCYEPSMLVSAVVYAQDTVLTTFEIRDDNGNVLHDFTNMVMPDTSGFGHRIYFNYEMTVGETYQIGINGNSENLYRNNSGVNYPYDFGTAASITSSSAGGNYYYFFYDVEMLVYPYNEMFICDGDTIQIGGNLYNSPGIYVETFVNSSGGCDSLVYTALDFYQTPPLLIDSDPDPAEICLGDTIILEASSGFALYQWYSSNSQQWIGQNNNTLFDNPTVDDFYLLFATDSNGCTVREDINVLVDSCITYIADNTPFEFNIYPNPSDGIFNIEFDYLVNRSARLSIINSLGKVIFVGELNTSRGIKEINLSHIRRGIYFVEIEIDDIIYKEKIIIQ